MVPELRDKLPGLETTPALDPEPARFRLFDSITTFLKNAVQSQPLMLVLGCYRDVELSCQHALSETLAQPTREPVFQRLVQQSHGLGAPTPWPRLIRC